MSRPAFLDRRPTTFREHIAVAVCAPVLFLATMLTLTYWLAAWFVRTGLFVARQTYHVAAVLVIVGAVGLAFQQVGGAVHEMYTAKERYTTELDRLILVDDAQAFAKRALGLAEMEAAQSADLTDRIKCLEDDVADLERALRVAQEYNHDCLTIITAAGLTPPVPQQAGAEIFFD